MALNWTMLDSSRNPVPLPDEMTILSIDSGAELTLTIPDALPQQGAAAGGSGGAKKLKETGRIQLTDQRVSLIQVTSYQIRDQQADYHLDDFHRTCTERHL